MKAFKAISQTFRVCIKAFLLFEACTIGGALFGGILELIISLTAGETVTGLAFMFAIMALFVMVLFGSVFGGYSDFAMSVYFCRSRKHFLFSKYIYYIVEYTIAALILLVVNYIETVIGSKESINFAVDGNTIFGAVAGILVIPLIVILFSALYAKFERKFFWFVWVLWMLGFIGGPRILSAMNSNPESTVAKIGFFIKNAVAGGTVESVIGIVIIAILAIIGNIVIYRNVDVRD